MCFIDQGVGEHVRQVDLLCPGLEAARGVTLWLSMLFLRLLVAPSSNQIGRSPD